VTKNSAQIQKPTTELPITVKEARKLLGGSSGQLSDIQVIEIITNLSLMARIYFNKSGSKNTSGL
jgi:hypothetical protein